jgi:hypothetical protein
VHFAAVRRVHHRPRLGLGLLKVQDVFAVRPSRVVCTAQGRGAVFVITDVAPEDPPPLVVVLPALPAEMHLAGHKGLPVRLAPAFQSAASGATFEPRVLDGAGHVQTKDGPKIAADEPVCRRLRLLLSI